MRVGIITNNNGLFSNGLSQNAYFLYEVLQNAGHECTMLCYDEQYKTLDGLDIPVKPIRLNAFDMSPYDIIITVAAGISLEMYKMRGKTKIIGFVCGNIYASHLVDFTTEDKEGGNRIIKKTQPIDIQWIIGAFDYMFRYMELMRAAPVVSVPHLWSPRLVEKHAIERFKYKVQNLHYKPELHTNGKLNLFIVEPNLSFVKSALLPLMISEALHQTHPDLIDTIFVFNVPKGGAFQAILDNLTIRSKVRIFKGLHIAEIIHYANAQVSMPIFLSHQIFTPWNYVYYEMLHFGIPLVHNSFKIKLGYIYKENDIDGAVNTIVHAHTYHAKLIEVQKKRNIEFLQTLDPSNPDTIQLWNNLLASSKSS